jgi:uncharacterized protein YggE
MENQELTMPDQNQSTSPELTVNDLTNIRQIIDAAVRRGTFSASEISGVGAVYDKLDKFLIAIGNQQPQK